MFQDQSYQQCKIPSTIVSRFPTIETPFDTVPGRPCRQNPIATILWILHEVRKLWRHCSRYGEGQHKEGCHPHDLTQAVPYPSQKAWVMGLPIKLVVIIISHIDVPKTLLILNVYIKLLSSSSNSPIISLTLHVSQLLLPYINMVRMD